MLEIAVFWLFEWQFGLVGEKTVEHPADASGAANETNGLKPNRHVHGRHLLSRTGRHNWISIFKVGLLITDADRASVYGPGWIRNDLGGLKEHHSYWQITHQRLGAVQGTCVTNEA